MGQGFSSVSGSYVKLNGNSNAIVNASTSDSAAQVVGIPLKIVQSRVIVQTSGAVTLNFDGATTSGDTITLSTTTAGYFHDTGGTTCSATTLGVVSQTVGSAGQATAFLGACAPSTGISGAPPAGSAQACQFYLTPSTFGGDNSSCQVFTAVHPGAFGDIGLSLGLSPISLAFGDGPSSAITIVQNDNGQQFVQWQNIVVAGPGGTSYPENDFYVSGGTIASPDNLIDTSEFRQTDYWGYIGGAWSLRADELVFYRTAGPTTQWIFQAITGLAEVAFSAPGVSAMGFSPASAGVTELNNGIPIAAGGSYAQLSLGLIQLLSDVVNPFIQAKNTQSATAPGAAKCDLRWIAGTNAGTGKIVAACGTSATEVTIADNVGASF